MFGTVIKKERRSALKRYSFKIAKLPAENRSLDRGRDTRIHRYSNELVR